MDHIKTLVERANQVITTLETRLPTNQGERAEAPSPGEYLFIEICDNIEYSLAVNFIVFIFLFYSRVRAKVFRFECVVSIVD